MKPIKLDEFLPYRIAVLAHAVEQAVTGILEDQYGLSNSQWRVMAAVAEKPGRTAQAVVRITPMEKAVVSRAVSALIGRGMMQREANANDGRSSQLYLTDAGRAAYADIAPEARKVERRMLRAVGDGKALRAAIAALEDALSGLARETA